MEKDYYLKAGEMTGVIKLSRLQAILAAAMEYIRIKEAIDSGIHKAYELSAKDYCEKICGIPYATYSRHENELQQLGKDLWTMKKLLGWKADEIQALTALSEDSRVKIQEKSNVLEIDGKKVSLDNKAEIQEVVGAILKREEFTKKEKELEQKEKKHLEKKLEGIGKEHEKERQAYQKEVTDLKAKVVDPTLPAGVAEIFKNIEGKTREIFTLATKIRFDDAHAQADDIMRARAREEYRCSIALLENQFSNAIIRLKNTFGVETGL